MTHLLSISGLSLIMELLTRQRSKYQLLNGLENISVICKAGVLITVPEKIAYSWGLLGPVFSVFNIYLRIYTLTCAVGSHRADPGVAHPSGQRTCMSDTYGNHQPLSKSFTWWPAPSKARPQKYPQFSSVQFSCSVMCNSLRPHESQHKADWSLPWGEVSKLRGKGIEVLVEMSLFMLTWVIDGRHGLPQTPGQLLVKPLFNHVQFFHSFNKGLFRSLY